MFVIFAAQLLSVFDANVVESVVSFEKAVYGSQD